MQSFQTILFDLDGTLTDPKEGIINSVIYALRKLDVEPPDPQSLLGFIGPPLSDSFRQYFGMSAQQAYRGVAYYREYFQDQGIYENLLFDGIPQLLAALQGAGKRVVLATSKPTVFAERILRHFEIDSYFDMVVGSNLDHTRIHKAEVIGYILEELMTQTPQPQRSSLVMVGDREHDILGAKQHQLASIGVLFGYGSREELQNAGATFLADSVSALQQLLLAGSGIPESC